MNESDEYIIAHNHKLYKKFCGPKSITFLSKNLFQTQQYNSIPMADRLTDTYKCGRVHAFVVGMSSAKQIPILKTDHGLLVEGRICVNLISSPHCGLCRHRLTGWCPTQKPGRGGERMGMERRKAGEGGEGTGAGGGAGEDRQAWLSLEMLGL